MATPRQPETVHRGIALGCGRVRSDTTPTSLCAGQAGRRVVVLLHWLEIPRLVSLCRHLSGRRGTLAVEALDGGGSIVATSADLNGDLPQGKVVWTQGSLADLQGRLPCVHLRFTLRNGSFYSYWIEE